MVIFNSYVKLPEGNCGLKFPQINPYPTPETIRNLHVFSGHWMILMYLWGVFTCLSIHPSHFKTSWSIFGTSSPQKTNMLPVMVILCSFPFFSPQKKKYNWLVNLTILKNMSSSMEGLSHTWCKIKVMCETTNQYILYSESIDDY